MGTLDDAAGGPDEPSSAAELTIDAPGLDGVENAPAAMAAPERPWLEVLDRDGQVRQSFAIVRWPLRIGRALDNDVVLSDPHVAPHHLLIEEAGTGFELVAGDTRNGVLLGTRTLGRGERSPFAAADSLQLTAGLTRLRLRLPGAPLAPELAIEPKAPLTRRLAPLLIGALVLALGVLFNTYLVTDPDGFGRAAGSTLLASIVGAAIWCGGWALLSKTFAHQARFGWHLRVFLFSGIAALAVDVLPALFAFAFSWPWLTDFAFIGVIVIGAGALYFHLLAVEPGRRRLLKGVATTCALVGVALTLWFNQQRNDLFGDELYMNHLFPPGLRIAKPVSTDAFIDGLAPLKAALDKKAKDPGIGEDDAGEHDDD
jgi:hypothetical protein